MSDKYVTVATFHRSFEAQLARNLLEEEGITSTLSGEFTADMLPFGQAGGGDQIVLQVQEANAQRAAGILAAVAAAKLEDNWEDEAESGSDVWVCTICGEPVSNQLSICYSCETPREGIRAGVPRNSTSIQPQTPSLPEREAKPTRAAITSTPLPAPLPPPVPTPAAPPDEDREEIAPTAAGDDLARRAFMASVIGLIAIFILPLAWYYLLRVVIFDGELSPKGVRHLYGALLINGFVILLVFLLCKGIG